MYYTLSQDRATMLGALRIINNAKKDKNKPWIHGAWTSQGLSFVSDGIRALMLYHPYNNLPRVKGSIKLRMIDVFNDSYTSAHRIPVKLDLDKLVALNGSNRSIKDSKIIKIRTSATDFVYVNLYCLIDMIKTLDREFFDIFASPKYQNMLHFLGYEGEGLLKPTIVHNEYAKDILVYDETDTRNT